MNSKSMEIEMVYCQKDKHIGKGNRVESPKINSNIYAQLIFNKGARTIQ